MALALISDVCRALIEAHKRGIVHRDVKPENILLLDESTQVKLLDFGLARHLVESESLSVTRTGTVVGTPYYMSPEQCRDSGSVDSRSDVYSIGATLFHVLAGRSVFVASTPLELLDKHCHEPPPPLKQFNSSASEDVCRIVAKTLNKDPHLRYQDAESLLYDLECVLLGKPTSFAAHPKLEAGSSTKALHYEWSWNLESSPEELWPYVSNTERFNRAIHLPAVEFTTEKEGPKQVRRFGRIKKAGMTVRWREHPFEWIEARRFGVVREFRRGPFRELVSVVDLKSAPEGGTVLTHSVRIEPRGIFGRLLAAVEVGLRARRAIGRVYRRVDKFLANKPTKSACADPYEETAGLSRKQWKRLDRLLARLGDCGVAVKVAEGLGEVVSEASAQEAARIRPLALASKLELDSEQFTNACLRGASDGLFVLLWDILCPTCRIASETKDTLRTLREHSHCPACDLDFELDLANSVEVIFRVHPEIRKAETQTYCIGGPAHMPHVAAQVRVAPGERMELELKLADGSYSLRCPQLSQSVDLKISQDQATDRCECVVSERGFTTPKIGFKSHRQLLILKNDSADELLLRVERAAPRADALTAAQILTNRLFRELFPSEMLAEGQLVGLSNITFLLISIPPADSGGDQTLADSSTLRDILAETVEQGGGLFVKSAESRLLYAFPSPVDAVRTGIRLLTTLEQDCPKPAKAGVGIHRGPALVKTENGRMDYTGATVAQVFELSRYFEQGKVAVSHDIASDPAVSSLLDEFDFEGAFMQVDNSGGLLQFLQKKDCAKH